MIHVGVFRCLSETERLLRTKQEGDYATEETTVQNGVVSGTVLRLHKGGVIHEAITDVPYADFVSKESSDGQLRLAFESIRAYPELALYAEQGYAFRPLKAGTSGEFAVDAAASFSAARGWTDGTSTSWHSPAPTLRRTSARLPCRGCCTRATGTRRWAPRDSSCTA